MAEHTAPQQMISRLTGDVGCRPIRLMAERVDLKPSRDYETRAPKMTIGQVEPSL
jgi:hypothetical protein